MEGKLGMPESGRDTIRAAESELLRMARRWYQAHVGEDKKLFRGGLVSAAWILSAVLLLTSMVLAYRYQGERSRRKQQSGVARWPLPAISLDALDPVFEVGPLGPTLETEVHFVGRGPIAVPGGTSDAEAWILAVLAKRSNTLFEFGTCTGKTAYLWSRNAAPGAKIVTLTLAPSQQHEYASAPGDSALDARFALDESVFDAFLYSGTAAEGAITQLYGDSKQFDEAPWYDWADVVFVDGSHARSYVESDSRKAMRMVKPGGLVLWHDYAGPKHAPGVFDALNELARTVTMHHVRGTTFAAWRRPVVSSDSGVPIAVSTEPAARESRPPANDVRSLPPRERPRTDHPADRPTGTT